MYLFFKKKVNGDLRKWFFGVVEWLQGREGDWVQPESASVRAQTLRKKRSDFELEARIKPMLLRLQKSPPSKRTWSAHFVRVSKVVRAFFSASLLARKRMGKILWWWTLENEKWTYAYLFLRANSNPSSSSSFATASRFFGHWIKSFY